MTIDFREIVNTLDRDEDVHLARILVLLYAFSSEGDASIQGITKLAKLDFLLRYPAALERALSIRDLPSSKIEIEDYERLAVEATMIRYRYGPWDHRYRRFINTLTAKGLTYASTSGRTVEIHITNKGNSMAKELSTLEEFAKIYRRALILKMHFNKTATWLTKFVYSTFPELTDMDFNEEIKLRG